MDTKQRPWTRLLNWFTAPGITWEEAKASAWADEARALDQRCIKKALKRSPKSPVLIARVITTREAQMLIGEGWRLRSSNRLQQWGSDLMSEHWLEKDNPNL